DKQLDECPLTFQDLGVIRESFVSVLQGMYHGRVPYPGERRRDQATVRLRRNLQELRDLAEEMTREEATVEQDPQPRPPV
ncbi:MAG: hypothetical protein FJ098_15840, partial [Deltaproteobacteria bacterium]|nr:hypothetical protein [Deltaproteobacteria bacterium]